MNRHVNAIAGRLSLRAPQRRSLEILDRITEIAPPRKNADSATALAAIRAEFPTVTDFEREFPSVCFALATGVGKTRLMGAFITYLHLAHGLKNFFVLAPNLTIYSKLIADFAPNTPKYVFRGIAEFATDPPRIITGENYESAVAAPDTQLFGSVAVNIFNISKINTEVRGGKSPRIKRLSEYIGESYFDYLAGLPDLVLIMDESHRYRASAGVRAINELKPVLGLELTATPQVETGSATTPFKNVIFDYPLGKAMADGFVKEPAVVTRKDFNPAGVSVGELERIKLEDGIRLHEKTKVELGTYAASTGGPPVKPFLLVIARDTTHAAELLRLIQSEAFFEGHYASKVIQVDSSQSGAERDETVERLLRVESPDEPTEIVVHVNMLKEGWDVTNLYTIVPLRAANARTLIEQSIGRGLRLPYGRRTGVTAVDRLSIVAHDRFQEIVDEANKPDSAIRLQQVILTPETLSERTVTVISEPILNRVLGLSPEGVGVPTPGASADAAQPLFVRPEDQRVAALTQQVIRRLETHPTEVPDIAYLAKPEVQASVVKEVAAMYRPAQLEIEGVRVEPDVKAIVAATIGAVIERTISIPKITVQPVGTLQTRFEPFALDLSSVRYAAVAEELWIQQLRTHEREVLAADGGGIEERRPEDYVVRGLADFDDICYEDHADLLYDLAGQVVRHLGGYLAEDQVGKVLQTYQRDIVGLVHLQMLDHFHEEVTRYEVKVTRGFVEIKGSAYTHSGAEAIRDFRIAPEDKSNMARYLFGAFTRCLFPTQKFHSDGERRLAVILDRGSLKWFKPAAGQFQIYYRAGHEQPEYQPDFVAETADVIYMLEVKARNELNDPIVQAKKTAATEWCKHASDYGAKHGGKLWRYALIADDLIAENMSLAALVERGS